MGQVFILRFRVQQEYNSLLVNALNRIFKSNKKQKRNLSSNNFKWLLTKLDLSCVRNSRKRLWNGYSVLNQDLQNHYPVGRHIPICTGLPPPPLAKEHWNIRASVMFYPGNEKHDHYQSGKWSTNHILAVRWDWTDGWWRKFVSLNLNAGVGWIFGENFSIPQSKFIMAWRILFPCAL